MKYTIQITNTVTGRYLKLGTDELTEWKKKTLSGKSAIYELLDRAETELGAS